MILGQKMIHFSILGTMIILLKNSNLSHLPNFHACRQIQFQCRFRPKMPDFPNFGKFSPKMSSTTFVFIKLYLHSKNQKKVIT